MSQVELSYPRFVSELCDCIGLPDWQQVASSGHLAIDGQTVGLVPDAAPGVGVSGGGVSVFIDLGLIPGPHRAKWHEAMLVANLTVKHRADGCYGLHPLSGNGVYHLRHALNQPPRALADRLDAVFRHVVPSYRDGAV